MVFKACTAGKDSRAPSPDAASMIGPTGGSVALTTGPVRNAKVVIPLGAMVTSARITLREGPRPTDLPPIVEAAGPVVRFGPEGQTFRKPVTITLPTTRMADRVYTRPVGARTWTRVPGARYNPNARVMVAEVTHFSDILATARAAIGYVLHGDPAHPGLYTCQFRCVGTLIAPNVVLTSASCLTFYHRLQGGSTDLAGLGRVTDRQDQPPVKGADLKVTMVVQNLGPRNYTDVQLTPIVTSPYFTDFTEVPICLTSPFRLGPYESQPIVQANCATIPFIYNPANGKRYALNNGYYTIPRVHIWHDGKHSDDWDFQGHDFTIKFSTDPNARKAVLVAALFDQEFLSKLGYKGSVDDYLKDALRRPSAVYIPSVFPETSEGDRQEAYYEQGFEQMMNVDFRYWTFPGWNFRDPKKEDVCNSIEAYANTALGLGHNWDGNNHKNNHGFDLLIGQATISGIRLGTNSINLGTQCSSSNVAVGMGMSPDREYQMLLDQVVLNHEMGHLFGVVFHSDDPTRSIKLKDYVMCSNSEVVQNHRDFRAKRIFLWDVLSFQVMHIPQFIKEF